MKLCSDHPCRWRRRKEARPEEIVEAALELFVEKGFSATRMDEVARKAGISKGTLYLYFDSKESIFHAVVQNIISPMIDEVEIVVSRHKGPAAELLKELMRGWWQTTQDSPLAAVPKLMISEAGNFPEMARFYIDNVFKRVRNLLEQVIRTGINSGEFRHVQVRTAARLLMAPVIQAHLWVHSFTPYDDPQDWESYMDLHLQLFMHGLKTNGQKT
jgi:AcrR family transcriptional regulator